MIERPDYGKRPNYGIRGYLTEQIAQIPLLGNILVAQRRVPFHEDFAPGEQDQAGYDPSLKVRGVRLYRFRGFLGVRGWIMQRTIYGRTNQ